MKKKFEVSKMLYTFLLLYSISIMIFYTSIWLVDICVGAINTNTLVIGLTNIGNNYDPLVYYHIGLMGVVLSSFLFMFLGLYFGVALIFLKYKEEYKKLNSNKRK